MVKGDKQVHARPTDSTLKLLLNCVHNLGADILDTFLAKASRPHYGLAITGLSQ